MIIVRAPLRISFFGGGTDHPDWFEKTQKGAVLSTAINKYVYIQLRRLPNVFDFNYRIAWREVEQVKTISEIKHPVVRAVFDHYLTNETTGYEVIYNADLPASSGLGSSSAFSVAMLKAFMHERGEYYSSRDFAKMAIHVEQDLLNEPVGCQDQVAVAVGGLNRIDFYSRQDFKVTPVTIDIKKRERLEDSFMMFFTGFTRSASKIEAEKKKNFDTKVNELTAMYDMVSEGEDILCNPRRDIDDFGRLLHDAWQAKRSLTASVSNSDIDEAYQAALETGALGGKLLGAGGGGFLLFYVPREKQSAVRMRLSNMVEVPFKFSRSGAEVVVFDPDLSKNYETELR